MIFQLHLHMLHTYLCTTAPALIYVTLQFSIHFFMLIFLKKTNKNKKETKVSKALLGPLYEKIETMSKYDFPTI